jgi:hypothetical protein
MNSNIYNHSCLLFNRAQRFLAQIRIQAHVQVEGGQGQADWRLGVIPASAVLGRFAYENRILIKTFYYSGYFNNTFI